MNIHRTFYKSVGSFGNILIKFITVEVEGICTDGLISNHNKTETPGKMLEV